MTGSPHPSVCRPTPAGTLAPRTRVRLVACVFVAVYLALVNYSTARRSATFDESLHLTAGYAALAQGEFRYDATHPPFLRMWAALPLLAEGLAPPAAPALFELGPLEWGEQSYDAAYHFVHDGGQADRLLALGRFMNSLWGVALGLLLFAWAREWLGFLPGVAVLLFYTIEPNLGAHFGLVTTDGGITCFIVGSLYFLWRLQRAWTPAGVAGLTLCFALAQASKFSGVVLVPVLGLLLAWTVWRGTAVTGRRALFLAVLLPVAAWLALWTTYGFGHVPGTGDGRLRFDTDPVVAADAAEAPVTTAGLRWVDRHGWLPNAYVQGFFWSGATSRAIDGYLLGEVKSEGRWYYFPLAFLVKTPAVLLLSALAGLGVAWRRGDREEGVSRAFLIVPPAIYLGVAMASGINLGVRHILPVYPFAVLLVGLFFRWLSDREPSGRWVMAGLALAAVLRFGSTYPYTLSHFNLLAGGSGRGIKYLADSNLDWGQHLKLLKGWMDRVGVPRINFAYFGSVDPAYYGIRYVGLPGSPDFAPHRRPELPGFVALSATIQTGNFAPIYAGFGAIEPIAVIGHSIRVYWVERWPEAEATGALDDDSLEWRRRIAAHVLWEARWPDEAVRHLRVYLAQRPGDAKERAQLGLALFQLGRRPEAMEEFLAAVDLDPTGDGLAGSLADLLRRNGAGVEAKALEQRAAERARIPVSASQRLGMSRTEPAEPAHGPP